MKKIIKIVLITCLILFLFACSNNNKEIKNETVCEAGVLLSDILYETKNSNEYENNRSLYSFEYEEKENGTVLIRGLLTYKKGGINSIIYKIENLEDGFQITKYNNEEAEENISMISTYNNNNDLIKEVSYLNNEENNIKTYSYEYDENGKILKKTDTKLNEYKYFYSENKLIKIEEYSEDELIDSWDYSYNEDGKIITVLRNNGDEIKYYLGNEKTKINFIDAGLKSDYIILRTEKTVKETEDKTGCVLITNYSYKGCNKTFLYY